MRSVSIIIPTYKGSENIRASVCSALAIKELEKRLLWLMIMVKDLIIN